MSYHNASCCFARLGLVATASEREIKTAFRGLALQFHPDKVPAHQKEHATQVFRELHDAYEEALFRASQRGNHGRNGAGVGGSNNASEEQSPTNARDDTSSTGTPPRQRQKKPKTDSEIKKAFHDVCDELDRQRRLRMQKDWDDTIRAAERTWTNNKNHEQCWKTVKSKLTISDIGNFARVFETSNPPLCKFLLNRSAKWSADVKAKVHSEERQRIARINRDWPEKADELKKWAIKDWMLMDFEGIAKKVDSSTAAQAIRQWKSQRSQHIRRDAEARQKKSANRIVRAFPDKQKIASILNGHCIFERQDIYDLLPDDIRTAIVTVSVYQSTPAKSMTKKGKAKKKKLPSAKAPPPAAKKSENDAVTKNTPSDTQPFFIQWQKQLDRGFQSFFGIHA